MGRIARVHSEVNPGFLSSFALHVGGQFPSRLASSALHEETSGKQSRMGCLRHSANESRNGLRKRRTGAVLSRALQGLKMHETMIKLVQCWIK